MLTNIKVDKIEGGEGAISSRITTAHLKVTFDEGGNGCKEFNFVSSGFYLRVIGDHNTNELAFLMEELQKKSKVNKRHWNRKGILNFNEGEEEENITLENKICRFASQVISAHEFIYKEKTLVFKESAKKKAPAKRKV